MDRCPRPAGRLAPIRAWRPQVCGDLTAAFDFESPIYGLPHLPETGMLIPETEYDPLPGDNTMPTQEPGTKPARPLPYQPNVNLTGFAHLIGHLETGRPSITG